MDCVLFQAATAIMEATSKSGFFWGKVTWAPVNISLNLCLTEAQSSKYVWEQILLAVTVIVKERSVDKSIDCKTIFHEVSQLISNGNPTGVDTSLFYSNCITEWILKFQVKLETLDWGWNSMQKSFSGGRSSTDHLDYWSSAGVPQVGKPQCADILSVSALPCTGQSKLELELSSSKFGQTLYSYVWILTKCAVKAHRVLDSRIMELFFTIHWKSGKIQRWPKILCRALPS